MRMLVAAAVALILGLAIGSLGPADDLRAAEARIAELESKECERPVGGELAALLQAGARQAKAPAGEAPPPRASRPARSDASDETPDDAPSAPPPAEDGPTADDGVDPFDAGRAALELRRRQARASLMEDAAPSDEQLDQLDAAFSEMNDSLFSLADELVARIEGGEELGRRDTMAFAAEALDTLVLADDTIYQTLSEEQRAQVEDAAVDPLSYIDPGIFDLLSSLDAP